MGAPWLLFLEWQRERRACVRLQVDYSSRAEQALEAAQLAQQLATDREAEAAAAHSAARAAQDAAAAAGQEARAAEKQAKALAGELDKVTGTKNARITHLEQVLLGFWQPSTERTRMHLHNA